MTPGALLAGKVVVITGTGHGIGRSVALEMARQGALLRLNNRSEANGRATLDEIRQAGGTAELTISSVAEASGARQVVVDCLRNYGRIDVLYANAGFIGPGDFEAMTEEQFDAVLGVHLDGAVFCCRAALHHMVERGFGRILMTGTPGAYAHAGAGHLNYAAAKGGVTAFMRSLYKEVFEHGVTVNTIVSNAPTSRRSPEAKAAIASRIRRWGRFGYAPFGTVPPSIDIVAPLIAYLVSDRAGDVTGRTIYVGGERMGLYLDPELKNLLAHPGGWDYEALRKKFRAVIPSGPPSPFFGDDPELIAGSGL